MAHDVFEPAGGPSLRLASRQLAALSQETRLAIMTLLSAGSPLNVSELAQLCGSQYQTVSHHLQILMAAGLVECGKDGRSVLYRVTPSVVAEVTDPRYLGGWKLNSMDVLLLAPEPQPEPQPEPEPEPQPEPEKKGGRSRG